MWLLKQTEIGIGWVGLREMSILSEAGREALHSPARLPFCPSCIHFGSTPHPCCSSVCMCVCGCENVVEEKMCMRVCESACVLGWMTSLYFLVIHEQKSECTAFGREGAWMEQGGGSDAVHQWEGDLTKHSIISKLMWKIWNGGQ